MNDGAQNLSENRGRYVLLVASVVALGLLPLIPLQYAFTNVMFDDAIVTDFRNTFYPAAESVLKTSNGDWSCATAVTRS